MVYNNDIPKYVTIQRGLWLIMNDVYTAGERNRTKKLLKKSIILCKTENE